MICISSGHGRWVRGASGYLDEVHEARKVVEHVAECLRQRGVDVMTFHDDTSSSQDQNLKTIVDWHNSQVRDLDVSVHFNAYQTTEAPMGTEVFYLTQADLAARVCNAIADLGFIFRGPKLRDDLYFLNNTDEPAILIEVCFVDSLADSRLYQATFGLVCLAIAQALEPSSKRTMPLNS
ncbi:MAG: N-acetylmuramoyl-L-alanine amidase [Rhizobiales bacterium]|nr:N-acetylmuramoyl-L-alanine amidase [Hyphomicrobiales bacterium]